MTPTIRRTVERYVAGAALCALLVPGALAGQTTSGDDPASNEGALFLLLPVGAKAVSLARAMTAMQGPESVFWNPAGLAALQGSQVVLMRGEHFAGPATTIAGLFSRPGLGTLGVSYFLLDFGEQDLTDDVGTYLGTLSVRNHLGVASAAAQVSGSVAVGTSFKVIQFRQSCRGSMTVCTDAGTVATTYAMDAGLQIEPTRRTRVGAMVAHMGPRLQVYNEDQADPLPWRMRFAVAYDVVGALVETEALAGWLAVELQDHVRDPGTRSYYVGTELSAGATDALFLRAGYGISELQQDSGASVGLGVRYEGFDLAIAKSLAVSTLAGETEPIHVTLSYLF